MWVIEAISSYSQLSQSSISGGRSLVQQIHNLCNLKNTCDHESKWEWETQKHWGSLVMPILCFGKSEWRSSAGQLPYQTWPTATSLFCWLEARPEPDLVTLHCKATAIWVNTILFLSDYTAIFQRQLFPLLCYDLVNWTTTTSSVSYCLIVLNIQMGIIYVDFSGHVHKEWPHSGNLGDNRIDCMLTDMNSTPLGAHNVFSNTSI